MTKTYIRQAVAAAFIAASAAGNVAFAVDEVEPNDSMSSAQEVVIGSAVVTQVTAAISSVTDIDYFYFEGQAGDVVTLDIDGVSLNPDGSRLDTMVSLFGPGLVAPLENDNPLELDTGSETTDDARIDKFNLPATGRFTLAISSWPRFIEIDGTPTPGMEGFTTGSYTLLVTLERPNAEPPPAPVPVVQHMNIEVRPMGRHVVRIHPKFKGDIPVALLSSENFDPRKVDRKSITFGVRGVEPSLRRCDKRQVDFNGDKRPDLLCHFDNEEAGFEEGDQQAVIKGTTEDGRPFEGTGPLKAVRGGKRHRHDRYGHNRHDHDRQGRR